MKNTGKVEHPRDLAHWPLVLEAKREQQPIVGTQLGDSSGERCANLLSPNLGVSVGCRFVEQQVRVDFLGNELLEPSSRLLFLLTIGLLASRSAVSVAEVVEDESSGDDDEPRREFYLRVGDVRAEPPAVVFTERLQRMGISIHRGIMIVRHRAAGMENDLAVPGNELSPDIVALP
jgi:hypothetical protein